MKQTLSYTERISHVLGFFGIITSEVNQIANEAFELEYDVKEDAEFIRSLMYTGIQEGRFHFGMVK